MHVDTDDLATLLKLQHIDLEILRANKRLEELPQRKAILEARTKRKAVEQKRAQLDALRADVERRLSDVGEEDAALAEKQRRAQAEIDEARDDYRSVEARSKELDGFARRRDELEARLSAIGEELEKVEGVQAQVARMLSDLDAEERAATESFVREGGALKDALFRNEAERASLASSLPKELLASYEKIAARTGGVAVGRLQGGSCGACRMAIEGGRLIDMKGQGNVGVCPQCGRLLVLE